MNPNWLGIISAILSLAAFFVVYYMAKKKPVKTRVVFSIVAATVAIPGASFAAYYTHIMADYSWYYQFRSIAGTEVLIVFVGVAGGLIATLFSRVSLILPLLITAIISVVPFIKPFIGPIPTETFKEKWDEEICMQSTPSTCGAASLATIFKQFGIEITESELAAEAHSYTGGTEAWYLARVARSHGLDAQFDFRSGFSPEQGLPAIVGVQIGSTGHFIAVLSREGDHYVVGDPLRGREILSKDELLENYVFSGFHLRIKNPSSSEKKIE